MLKVGMDNVSYHRLRFVFQSQVMSFGLAPDATLEDVGRTMDDVVMSQNDRPIAIDVTLSLQQRKVRRHFSYRDDQ